MLHPASLLASRSTWFGYYDPSRPIPAGTGHLRQFQDALLAPVNSSFDLRRFLKVMEGGLPSLAGLGERIREGGIQLALVDQPNPRQIVLESGRLCLEMPRGSSPGFYFPAFLLACPGVIALPEGVNRGTMISPRSPHFREAYRRFYSWNMAMGLSFIFQAAFEMRERGLRAIRPDWEGGVLRPKDLALFRIFREEGLQGLAMSYLTFFEPQARQCFEEDVEAMVDSVLYQGLEAADDWNWPERCDTRPDLPRTFVDEAADRAAGWGRGFYQSRSVISSASSTTAYDDLLDRPLQTMEDVRTAFRLMRELAPRFAAEFLGPFESGKVSAKIVSGTNGEVAILGLPISCVFGIPGREEEAVLELTRGVTLRRLLPEIACELGRGRVPEEIFRHVRLRDGATLQEIIQYLEFLYRVRGAWSCSVRTEFVAQAHEQGVEFASNDVDQKYADLLDTLGLEILIDRYVSMMPAPTAERVRRQMEKYARFLVGSAFLADCIRFTQGKIGDLEDIARLSSTISAAYVNPGGRGVVSLLLPLALPSAPSGVDSLRAAIARVEAAFVSLPRVIRERETMLALALERLRRIQEDVAESTWAAGTGRSLVEVLITHLSQHMAQQTAPQTGGPRITLSLVDILTTTPDRPTRDVLRELSRVRPEGDIFEGLRVRARELRDEGHQQQRALREAQREADRARDREEEARRLAEAREREHKEKEARREREAKAAREQEELASQAAQALKERLDRARQSVMAHRESEALRLVGLLEDDLLARVLSTSLPETALGEGEQLRARVREVRAHFDASRAEAPVEAMLALCDELRSRRSRL